MGFFDRIFGKNQPGHLDGYLRLVEQSMEELRLKTAAHDAGWHLSEAAWNVDQDTGLIVFTRPDGIKATCPVQIIGTYNTEDGTWLWGWEHPSVVPPLQEHAKRVKEYGEQHGLKLGRKNRCSKRTEIPLQVNLCPALRNPPVL